MKKYRTLQRKVEGLESLIRSIFSGEEERCRQRFIDVADDIERRLVFLKSHIAAESSSPVPDHHLSHLSGRFDALRSTFARLKNNLLHDHPLDCPHHLDPPSSCSCSDDDDEGPGPFKVYDNPLSFDGDEDEQDVINYVREELIRAVREEGREKSIEKRGCYWRPMVLGGVTVAAAVVFVVLRYGVRCRFSDNTSTSISVFPPPT